MKRRRAKCQFPAWRDEKGPVAHCIRAPTENFYFELCYILYLLTFFFVLFLQKFARNPTYAQVKKN